MKKLYYLLLFGAALSCSCGEKNPPDTDPDVRIGSESPFVEITEEGRKASISFPMDGGEASLTVAANRDKWEYEPEGEWYEVIKTGNTLTIKVGPASLPEELTGSVKIICRDGEKSAEAALTVIQSGTAGAYLSFTSESEFVEIGEDGISGTVMFFTSAGEAEMTVSSNRSGWKAFSSNEGWCTVSVEGDILTIKAKENVTVYEQKSTITIQAGDADDHAVAVFEATQGATKDNMIWEVSVNDATSNTAILPLDHTSSGALVNCVVDWGDGSKPERFVTGYPTHQYAESGNYFVSVTGKVNIILGNYVTYFPTTYRQTIKGIRQWGNLGIQSMKNGFYYFDGLEYLAKPSPESFTHLKDIYSCFEKCVNLKAIPEGMFENAPVLAETYCAFSGCESVEAIPDRVFANCSSATRFSMAFKNLKSAKSIGEDVFKGCSASAAFLQAFFGCENIEEIPAGLFADASLSTDYSYAFGGCKKLKRIPADLFKGSPEVTNFANVFNGCTALGEIPPSLFDNNPKVTNFGGTFNGCAAITGESPYSTVDGIKIHLYERDAPGFTKPATFKSCFKGCTSLSDYATIESGYGDWIL